ncbi:unnamed protein product [Prorocentrum cordatum]|uniref:Apple domain-containing protein n=2 Tax=Prorocentrum cordatum TaxID=2364126 RepID=A0ABN9X4B7_9DINO|nr:unnamed protein product [Polarella glacialis]
MTPASAAAGGPRGAAPTLQVVGLVLQRRLFSLPLPFDTTAGGRSDFLLQGPGLPDHLRQFQEALDLVLGALPRVDWGRCGRGDAMVRMMVRQVRAPRGLRGAEAARVPEASDSEDVFMNLPHHDNRWGGAGGFRGERRTSPHDLLPPGRGSAARPVPSPRRGALRRALAALGARLLRRRSRPWRSRLAPGSVCVLPLSPSALHITAWDPLWSVRRFPDFLAKLTSAPAPEWHRPSVCEAEDVVQGCFDAAAGFSCEQCCDLRRGAMGDSACWAGWMTYEMMVLRARLEALGRLRLAPGGRPVGPGLLHGAPKLHSPAQCQQRCEEDPLCEGWTYFPLSWQPLGCRLPLAAVMGLRRVCLLRGDPGPSAVPHEGVLWGPLECAAGASGCLEVGLDRSGPALAILKEVPDAAACRGKCRSMGGCRSFAFFPDHYRGDASEQCELPPEVVTWWAARCQMKVASAAEGSPVFLPMGNVVSGARSCPAAAPWLGLAQAPGADLVVDEGYQRERCAVVGPWRRELDAEYLVSQAILWLGELTGLADRSLRPRQYDVVLVTAGPAGPSEVHCGTALELASGSPVVVDCVAPSAAYGVEVRAQTPSAGFSLCEVELRLAPVPCAELVEHEYILWNAYARVFPRGAAERPSGGTPGGEACERRGGSPVLVGGRGGAPVCLEAACAPSECLEEFDRAFDVYAPLSGFDLWDARSEAAAAACGGDRVAGTFFEATVVVHVGGRSEEGTGKTAVLHWSFCAPGGCSSDDAARVAVRVAASKGLELSALPPGSEVEVRGVRPLARWEDVRLDFLIAGFARSGTHSLLLNLASHPEVSREDLTFNWGYVPMQQQIQQYAAAVEGEGGHGGAEGARGAPAPGRRLRGGKGEGVALNPRILRLLSRARGLKLVVMVREPVEWLESLYNLRALECRSAGDCGELPTLEDVILRGAQLKDARAADASLSTSLEVAAAHFPPRSGRLLLLEFELLKARPRELFDRLTGFLGISPFPADHSFGKFGTEQRAQYRSQGTGADLCSEELRPALLELRRRLGPEHHRLAHCWRTPARPGCPAAWC